MNGQELPLVLVADDDVTVVRTIECQLRAWGYRTAGAVDRAQLTELLGREQPCLLVLDLHFGEDNGIEVMRELLQGVPTLPVLLLTGHGTIDTAVEAIKLGAYDYLTKPPDWPRLHVTLEHAREKHSLRKRIRRLEEMVEPPGAAPRIWGDSPAIHRLRALIANVAPTDATVLVRGESGTGKELVAQALHAHSRRAKGPFVPVNMAALPRELVESTLFGHEKGAFTGADRIRLGCCEAADGGTLFLDEVAEMGLDLQAKLLRFLQDHTLQRVGSSRTQAVDVRIVAATNKDLQECVGRGQFREDLYYRLNVVPIEVPPLRERRDDVVLLASRFLTRSAARHGKNVAGFTAEALAMLTRYDWPGNVRHLENLVERLVILTRGPDIGVDDLPKEFRAAPPTAVAPDAARAPGILPIAEVERRVILDALRRSKGNVRDAAGLLGLGQATVYRKIKRYDLRRVEGIDRPEDVCSPS